MAEVSLDDVETAMLTQPEPVVTVSDLDDRLDCSDRHILTLLRGLEQTGVVHSKQIGARAVAWWHTARVRSPLPTAGTGQHLGEDAPATDDRPHDAAADDKEERPT